MAGEEYAFVEDEPQCRDQLPDRFLAVQHLLPSNTRMTLSDWRWAAKKGFWDSEHRCWNDDMGGMKGYIAQRNKRCADRLRKQARSVSNLSTANVLFGTMYNNPSSALGFRAPFARPLDEPSLGPAPPPLLAFMAQQGWAPPAVRRHWAAHRAAPAMRLFAALPPAVRDAVRDAIDAAQLCAACAAACAGSPPPPPAVEEITTAAAVEEEDGAAVVERRFDPVTQARDARAHARADTLTGACARACK